MYRGSAHIVPLIGLVPTACVSNTLPTAKSCLPLIVNVNGGAPFFCHLPYFFLHYYVPGTRCIMHTCRKAVFILLRRLVVMSRAAGREPFLDTLEYLIFRLQAADSAYVCIRPGTPDTKYGILYYIQQPT